MFGFNPNKPPLETEARETCQNCYGKGIVKLDDRNTYHTCPHCRGTGYES